MSGSIAHLKPPLLFLANCIWLVSYAQHIEDWKKTFPDAEAVYAKMSNYVKIDLDNDSLTATSQHSEDLVYLTENGVKLMSRGFIYHSSFNVLNKWDAYTQVAGVRKIKVTDSKTINSQQDWIFYDDAKQTMFDYSGASVGANSHLDYEIQHTDAHLLTPFYFDRYFPVINGELKIIFPEEVSVKYVIKGNHAQDVKFQEQRKKGKVTYTFSVTNFQDDKRYADAPEAPYYATHIIYYVDKYKNAKGEWINFQSGTDDLYKNSYKFIKDVNKELDNTLKKTTDSLIAGIKSPREKAKKVYQWVQTNIKYVAFEEGMGGFVPREANLVCSRRFGDCKDMTSILTAMLNYAQIQAYFTWIGTRDIPYDYTEIPLAIVDNHMICTIKLDNDYIFLDGTASSCEFGIPPYQIQGKQAMISLGENDYKIVRVPVMEKTYTQYDDTTFLELSDRGLSGKIHTKLTGYMAITFGDALSIRNEKENDDYFKNRFQRGSNKTKLSDFQVERSKENNQFDVRASIKIPDYAKKIGDEWYLNMNLYKWYEHQEIDYPKRKVPIEFNFKKTARYVTVLKIPDGYKIGYIPPGKTYHNDVWGFDITYEEKPGQLILIQEFDTEQLMLYPDQFEAWNKVLENLFPLYKESILISKK
jgi:hypothetical protein